MFNYYLRLFLCHKILAFPKKSPRHSNKLFKSIQGRLLKRLTYPLQVNFETTRNCNLKCSFCAREQGEKLGNIDFESVTKVVHELTLSNQPTVFGMHMWGEPLLNPETFKIIQYIKSQSTPHKTTLTTNGTLLSQENNQQLIESGLDQVIISYHTTDAKKFEELIGRKIEQKELQEKILELLEQRNKTKSKLQIVLRLFEEPSEKNEFIELCKKKGCTVEFRVYNNSAGHTPHYQNKSKAPRRWPCYRVWLTATVTANGDITPCCVDLFHELKVGSTRNATLLESWSSEKLQKIRKEHQTLQFDKYAKICENCDSWKELKDIGL